MEVPLAILNVGAGFLCGWAFCHMVMNEPIRKKLQEAIKQMEDIRKVDEKVNKNLKEAELLREEAKKVHEESLKILEGTKKAYDTTFS